MAAEMSPSRPPTTAAAIPARRARPAGAEVGYRAFLDVWADASKSFDLRSDVDDREFSMDEVAGAVLDQLLGRQPTPSQVAAVVDSYLTEWNSSVVYPPAGA